MQPLPHRVTILPAAFTLPDAHRALESTAALLLFTTLFEHLIRHPRLAVTDPDDFRITDNDNRLLNAHHPRIENVKAYEFYENRRDEVLWFEFALDGAVQLAAQRAGVSGTPEFFAPAGPGALSELLQTCLARWLAARGLGAAPRALEAFTAQDFWAAVSQGQRLLEAYALNPGAARAQLTTPPKLAVPYCRFVGVTLGIGVERTILQLDADNPWALRDDHLNRWHNQGAPRDEVRRVIQLAPAWGKPHGLMWGDGVTPDETLYHAGINAALNAANPFALNNYASALHARGRYEESFRFADRAAALFPTLLRGHMIAMDAVASTGRVGHALRDAEGRLAQLEAFLADGTFTGAEPDVCMLRLRRADARYEAGRLAEAIQLRQEALERVGNPRDWPKMTEVLRAWRSDPALLAFAYAREGFYRGDYGRGVEGSTRAPLDTSGQLAVLVESLVMLGRADEAALTYALHSRRAASEQSRAQLAGALAHLAAGQLATALDAVTTSQLRNPQQPIASHVNRLLRVASARPLPEWDAAVHAKLAVGARRVGALLARDAADFAPGAAGSEVIAQALANVTPAVVTLDESALAALRARLAPADLARVDALFARSHCPTLADADALYDAWPDAAPRPHDLDDGAAREAHEAALLYALAQALCRYLALATQRPTVMAGAFRQIATDVLLALVDVGAGYTDATLRAFFEAIERHAGGDPWLLDTWLLRVERALDLDRSRGGHLAPLVDGLPRVSALVRGDERVATELRAAETLAKDPRHAAAALEYYERSTRATGGNAAVGWSDVAAATLPPARALDVHHTAVMAHPLHAGPAVNAAHVLLGYRMPDAALAVLAARLGYGGKQYRDAAAERLRDAWQASGATVPVDFAQCQTRAFGAMQAGRFAEALALYQWCDALDPGNAALLRNMGLAAARLGRTLDAMAYFGEADATQGAVWAAQQLLSAGQFAEATRAYRVAALGPLTPDLWLQYAGAAFAARDDAATAEAYEGAARTLGAPGLDATQLNAYAGALDNLGEYEACEEVARRLRVRARGDAALTACAHHHMACSLLGRGRGPEGVEPAQQAVQLNPEPSNAAVFQETLRRCHANAPRPATPRPARRPEGQAFALLARGEFRAVLPLAQAHASWAVRRAALAASAFRDVEDNGARVARGALDVARWVLAATAGATEVDALLCRAHAARIREDALYYVDAPPPLAARLTREQFEQALAQPPRTDARADEAAPGAPPAVVSGAPGDADPEIFPGTRLPRLSDYVAVLRGMQRGDPMGALKRAGLDMAAYGQLAAQWAQRLAADPLLTARFHKLLQN